MNPLLRSFFRRRGGADVAPPPPPAAGAFKIGANVGGSSDYAADATFVDKMRAFRGFGTTADPLRNGSARPALDINGWPSEDFGVTVPRLATSASIQTCKCRLGGLATITVSGAGWSLANQSVAGDVTTFDLVCAANNVTTVQATITFVSSKRTAAGATNTGCTSLVIKEPGYSVADATEFMPTLVTMLSRFSRLRFMDMVGVNNNTFTVLTTDRSTDGAHGYGMPLESCARLCNLTGANLWFNVPVLASDALITAFATAALTSLDANKNVLFELGNENWNATFAQLYALMDAAFAICNGYSSQYHSVTHPISAVRAANVTTMTFAAPHGILAGDRVRQVGLGTVGVKTVSSVPTTTTLTVPDAGADSAAIGSGPAGSLAVFDGVMAGRTILSLDRFATDVLTVEFGIDHGISNGATVRTNGVGTVTGARVVTSVPTARTITLADVGAIGSVGMGGGTSLVADFTTPLTADLVYDQFNIQRRYYAKRTKEMSDLIKAVYGANFGTRAKVGLFCQPGDGQANQMVYLTATFGPPSGYLHVMGEASYIFLDATPFGGPNLRSVGTYNGNTPPLKSDYAAALALTAVGARAYAKDNYDRSAAVASTYGLKLWQYEFGPDMTGIPVDNLGAAVGQQKIDSLFDPSFKPSYRALLDGMESAGFEEVMCYHAGSTPVGSFSEYASWGFVRDFSTPSPRSDAIDEKRVAPRTGSTRNLLNGTSGAVTTIDGGQWAGSYTDGAYHDLDAGLTTPGLDFVITAPVAGVYSFVATLQCLTSGTQVALRVNGTLVGASYVLTPGPNPIVEAARNITLNKGLNVVRFEKGAVYLGNLAQALSLSFTAPP